MTTRAVRVAPGRDLAVDDLGTGSPVLYLHGTPDSRLARHPDDTLPGRLGVRLLAPDRPGIGESTVDPSGSLDSVADDLAAMLDALGIERVGVLAWSAGALFALGLAGRHPQRVDRLVLAAPLVPADAYTDPDVIAAAGESRAMFASMVGTMAPRDLAAEVSMFLAVPHCDPATAREMVGDAISAVADIAGAGDRLVAAHVAATVQGLAGVELDLSAQATPLGATIDAVTAPVSIHVGTADTVTPPPMARWLGERLGATVTVHDGDDHSLALHRWEALVVEAAGQSTDRPG